MCGFLEEPLEFMAFGMLAWPLLGNSLGVWLLVMVLVNMFWEILIFGSRSIHFSMRVYVFSFLELAWSGWDCAEVELVGNKLAVDKSSLTSHK
jgi:hypothetical protein